MIKPYQPLNVSTRYKGKESIDYQWARKIRYHEKELNDIGYFQLPPRIRKVTLVLEHVLVSAVY